MWPLSRVSGKGNSRYWGGGFFTALPLGGCQRYPHQCVHIPTNVYIFCYVYYASFQWCKSLAPLCLSGHRSKLSLRHPPPNFPASLWTVPTATVYWITYQVHIPSPKFVSGNIYLMQFGVTASVSPAAENHMHGELLQLARAQHVARWANWCQRQEWRCQSYFTRHCPGNEKLKFVFIRNQDLSFYPHTIWLTRGMLPGVVSCHCRYSLGTWCHMSWRQSTQLPMCLQHSSCWNKIHLSSSASC